MITRARTKQSQQLLHTQQQALEQQEAPAVVTQVARGTDRQLAFASPELPDDIVYLVLKQAAAAQFGPCGTVLNARERLTMLSNAALVCSVWREPAQALMWEHVGLESTQAVESFSLSTGKHRRTVSLTVYPRQQLNGKLAEQIVTSCRGLEKLELHNIQDLDSSTFRSKYLSKLKHLYISCTVIFQPQDEGQHGTMEIPFVLDYLHLGTTCGAYDTPPPLVAALLSKVTSELSLELAVMHEASEDAQPLFTTVPNTLHILRLADGTPEPDSFDMASEPAKFDVNVFIPLMQQSRALKTLELPAAGLRLLYSLSSAVEKLYIVLAPSESQDPLLDWVEWAEAAAPEIISRLQVVDIETFGEAEEWQGAEMTLLGHGINVSLFEL